MNGANRSNRTILALAIALVAMVALRSLAATIYVSGPSTNASPLRFKAIGGGWWHSIGVLSNGTVVVWGGDNYFRQFAEPSGLSGVIAVAGGDDHTLALKSDGTVVAWGDTNYGQSTVPSGLSNVVGIAAGGFHSLAVRSDGTVVGWGQPGSPVDDVTGVVAVAAGHAHNLALKSNGTVLAWGADNYGSTTVPAGLSNVVAIAAGDNHSLALKSNGMVIAWGYNALGQTAVPGDLSDVVAISAGKSSSMALKSDGTVVTWGYPLNQDPMPGLSNVVAIAAGGYHYLALRSDGTLVAWGDNRWGQTDVPGSSTTDHNIQDAVDSAQDGDTVLVGPGDYALTNQITVTKAIRLQSTDGASQTFLAGYGNWCLAISNALAVADGFTLRPGPTNLGDASLLGGAILAGGTIQNCNFTNFSPAYGSIVMSGGTVSNVVVTYNRGPGGVAVSCSDSGLITDSQILGTGGGASATTVALINSRLQNSVISGVPNFGGPHTSVAVSAISSTIVGCTISNNFNYGKGGGAYLENSTMDRCIVTGNTAAYGYPGYGGGGIFETNSVIRNSLIVANGATIASGDPVYGGFGGGVYMQGGALVNCTVSENSAYNFPDAPGAGGGIYLEGNGTVTNSIIYFNTLSTDSSSSNWFNAGLGIFDHSCTAPHPGGAGNVIADPQFVNAANGNFHLASTSPCIDAGIVQPWMTGAQDLDGNSRVNGVSVDIGAYESAAPPILSITRSGANIILHWPSAGTAGLVLQQSGSVASPQGWTPSGATVTDDGTHKSATIPATNTVQFFRLR